jgi:ribosomal protein S3AE
MNPRKLAEEIIQLLYDEKPIAEQAHSGSFRNILTAMIEGRINKHIEENATKKC